jgi:hypothetical protein
MVGQVCAGPDHRLECAVGGSATGSLELAFRDLAEALFVEISLPISF